MNAVKVIRRIISIIEHEAHPDGISEVRLPFLFLLAATTFFGSPVQAQAMCQAATTITTESELNDAIDCFNMGNPAGNHTVTIESDFNLASTASISEITRSEPSSTLTLQGSGIESVVTGNGSSPTTPAQPILNISGSSPITIRNLRLRAAPGAAVQVSGLESRVTLEEVTLFDNGTGLQIQSADTVQMSDSTVNGNRRGGVVAANSAFLTLDNVDVRFNAGNGVSVTAVVEAVLRNSRITNHFSGANVVADQSIVDIQSSVLSHRVQQ